MESDCIVGISAHALRAARRRHTAWNELPVRCT
jgi:hypothetical protein